METPEIRQSLTQLLPEKFLHLTKYKKLLYHGVNIKTDNIINLINDILLKYYFNRNEQDTEVKFNMWSIIMKSKYGEHYNHYVDYLIEHKVIKLHSNHFQSKKARTYKINKIDFNTVTRVKVYDTVLLKKNSRESILKAHAKNTGSTIPIILRNKLTDDLSKIELQYTPAMSLLNNMKRNDEINQVKYEKNKFSLDNIKEENTFVVFDSHGRMHTNFTTLKREIRKNYLSIDGEKLIEIDINNSQPLFLAVLMKEELPINELLHPEITKYFELVKNGLIYEYLVGNCNILDRKEAKIMMYRVMFGRSEDNNKHIKMFNTLFPNVYSFIEDYKSNKGDYTKLSHKLQNLESLFIYNTVITNILKVYPDITLFTVHDSICYQPRYTLVKDIFEKHRSKLI